MPRDKSGMDKKTELIKYRDLVLATIYYHLANRSAKIKSDDYDSDEHYKSLKVQTEVHFNKGRLTILKQWFRDLTEGQVECCDLKFNKYLQDKSQYHIDIFEDYLKRVEKIIESGKIKTDNQFYDINIMVDQLCQLEPIDKQKIDILNKLLSDFEQVKSRLKSNS